MIIRAYRSGEASFVAPFDYLKLILAGLIGFAVFDEVPGLWTFAGAAVIVGATLYIARREAARELEPRGERRVFGGKAQQHRSEEHTSELQSLMRISYAVFCLKKKQDIQTKVTNKIRIHKKHKHE